MKKCMLVLMFVLAGVIFTQARLSAQDTIQARADTQSQHDDIIRATVISIDMENNQIVVRRPDGEVMTIAVPEQYMKQIKIGKRYRIWLKEGTTQARHLRRIIHHSHDALKD